MTETVKRTGEIEEPTNRWLIHPLSRALVTPLARWGVSPNAVSIAGLVFGAGAALAYFGYTDPINVAVGFVLMIAWHVMDGADGQLARLTGKTSEIGKLLDGFCDHGTFVLIYVSLAAAASQVHGAWVWGLAVLAGASHAVQANLYETQRHRYDRWVHGKESSRVPTPEEVRRQSEGARGFAWVLGKLNLLYVTVQERTSRGGAALRDALLAARQEPGGDQLVREVYRETHLAGIRRWNLLCSNYRTVAIAVACLIWSPVLFFAFEVVVLNGLFALLLAMTRRNDRALLARLETREAASAETTDHRPRTTGALSAASPN